MSASERRFTAALQLPFDEARRAIRGAPVLNTDETTEHFCLWQESAGRSWRLRSRLGWKKGGKRPWLWTAASPKLVVYQLAPRRNIAALHALIGEIFEGVMITDRYGAYRHLVPARWQICWAHLRRDFRSIAVSDEAHAELGDHLLTLTDELFDLWEHVKSGAQTLDAFRAQLEEESGIITQFDRTLITAGALLESRVLAGRCRRIHRDFASLWTFTRIPGVEPTNNAAEQALRRAVLWRKISQGTRSDGGQRYVERMMTVVETCRRQGRSVIEYLHAVLGVSEGSTSLLPA